MRKIFLFVSLLLISLTIYAQAPDLMTYQSVVRDAGGNLVANDNVGFRVSLLQGSASGPSVYTETHVPMTNANGLATFQIGGGVIVSGNISTIDWSAGPYFIKTEVDPAGGTSYSITSTHQLLSVPYALYAEVAGSNAVVRKYMYLTKKATIQNIPTGTTPQPIISYDVINASGITINNSTGVITFDESGVYMITAHTSFYAVNTGRKLMWFECVSTLWPDRIACQEMSGDANRFTTSFLGEFNAGDQITLTVAQQTGITTACPNTSQAFDETRVNIEKVF